MPNARAFEQNPDVAETVPLYSTFNTSLLAERNGCSVSHSSYWLHSSLRFQSKAAAVSASVVSTPFFWPTDRPRMWACRATSRYQAF